LSPAVTAVAYALVGLVVAVLVTRWFMDDESNPDGPGLNGMSGLAAGVFWPVVLTIVALYWLGRGVAWLAAALPTEGAE
jgi:hypothetical protein